MQVSEVDFSAVYDMCYPKDTLLLIFACYTGSTTSGLSYGALSEADTLEPFDSAPVADYRPYIVNPEATMFMTSRLMWGR